jgi:hypothetical protein
VKYPPPCPKDEPPRRPLARHFPRHAEKRHAPPTKETPPTPRIIGKASSPAAQHPSARDSPDLPCNDLADLSPATTTADLPLTAVEMPPLHWKRPLPSRSRTGVRVRRLQSLPHRPPEKVGCWGKLHAATSRSELHSAAAVGGGGGRPPPPSLRATQVVPATRFGGGTVKAS